MAINRISLLGSGTSSDYGRYTIYAYGGSTNHSELADKELHAVAGMSFYIQDERTKDLSLDKHQLIVFQNPKNVQYGSDSEDILYSYDYSVNLIYGSNGNDNLLGAFNGDTRLYGGDGGDELWGSTDSNNHLYGGDGDDYISGGFGDSVNLMYGGNGDDTYVFARGDGSDKIIEKDGTADHLKLMDIKQTDLWFERDGNHLQISVLGSTDKITIQNWYLDGVSQIERIDTADFTLYKTDIEQLVQAMAAFTLPDAKQTNRISGQFSNNDQMLLTITN